jgi:hypothetical protein
MAFRFAKGYKGYKGHSAKPSDWIGLEVTSQPSFGRAANLKASLWLMPLRPTYKLVDTYQGLV